MIKVRYVIGGTCLLLAAYLLTTQINSYAWTNPQLGINADKKFPIKAVHLTELKDRIDAVRSQCSLPAENWNNSAVSAVLQVAPGTRIRASHIQALRNAVQRLYTAKGQAAMTNNTAWNGCQAADTAIHTADLADLRTAVDHMAAVCSVVPVGYCWWKAVGQFSYYQGMMYVSQNINMEWYFPNVTQQDCNDAVEYYSNPTPADGWCELVLILTGYGCPSSYMSYLDGGWIAPPGGPDLSSCPGKASAPFCPGHTYTLPVWAGSWIPTHVNNLSETEGFCDGAADSAGFWMSMNDPPRMCLTGTSHAVSYYQEASPSNWLSPTRVRVTCQCD